MNKDFISDEERQQILQDYNNIMQKCREYPNTSEWKMVGENYSQFSIYNYSGFITTINNSID